jgi:hypothetical protein
MADPENGTISDTNNSAYPSTVTLVALLPVWPTRERLQFRGRRSKRARPHVRNRFSEASKRIRTGKACVSGIKESTPEQVYQPQEIKEHHHCSKDQHRNCSEHG